MAYHADKNDFSGLDPETFQSERTGTVDNGLRWSGNAVDTLNQFAIKTFGWMFAGLLATFGVAYLFCASGLYYTLYQAMPFLPFVLMIGELVLVIVLSARLQKMSAAAAGGVFFAYAVLNGITFSYVFAMYLTTSVIFVFAMTALYFGALAAYGWLTKRDLTRLAPILIIGAVVLMIFWVLSMFLNFSGLEKIACFVGLAVFMGFTAYDTQKMKQMYAASAGNAELTQKLSVYMALSLYLDFINMFLYLLRLLGRRSN